MTIPQTGLPLQQIWRRPANIGQWMRQVKGAAMPGTYKTIELVGTSPVSFAEAVKTAVDEASKTVRHMDWFEVVSQRGRIAEGRVEEFQVTIKVGFKIER